MPKRNLKRKDIFSEVLKEHKDELKIKEINSEILHLDDKRVIVKSTIETENFKISSLGEALLEGNRSDAAVRLAETRAELRAFEKLFKLHGLSIKLEEDLNEEQAQSQSQGQSQEQSQAQAQGQTQAHLQISEKQIKYASALLHELEKLNKERAESAKNAFNEALKKGSKKSFSNFIKKLQEAINEEKNKKQPVEKTKEEDVSLNDLDSFDFDADSSFNPSAPKI